MFCHKESGYSISETSVVSCFLVKSFTVFSFDRLLFVKSDNR